MTALRGSPIPDVKRVLLVDSTAEVHDVLRERLATHRPAWTVRAVATGGEALRSLETELFSAVISDVQVAEMEGARLLGTVRDLQPTAVRVILSGESPPGRVAGAAGVAHRLVAKPCQAEDLVREIERACALQEMSTRVELSRWAAGAGDLPSVPRIYIQLTEVLADDRVGAEDVARVVERDPAMAAKVLQLANSAYFGRRQPVSRIAEAVAYLGLDAVRSLTLQAHAFAKFAVNPPLPGLDAEALQRHSARVARLASVLSAASGGSAEAFAAGLLVDVGLLVLAGEQREELGKALEVAREQRRPLHEVEREHYGVSHAEVGAHLLALWGLPHSVTEAVAYHHDRPSFDAPFDGIAITHVANLLVEELESRLLAESLPNPGLDWEYLEQAGVAARVPHWRELASRQFTVA